MGSVENLGRAVVHVVVEEERDEVRAKGRTRLSTEYWEQGDSQPFASPWCCRAESVVRLCTTTLYDFVAHTYSNEADRLSESRVALRRKVSAMVGKAKLLYTLRWVVKGARRTNQTSQVRTSPTGDRKRTRVWISNVQSRPLYPLNISLNEDL